MTNIIKAEKGSLWYFESKDKDYNLKYRFFSNPQYIFMDEETYISSKSIIMFLGPVDKWKDRKTAGKWKDGKTEDIVFRINFFKVMATEETGESKVGWIADTAVSDLKEYKS